jgi:HSP20 family molecular chaperone IbpA
MATMTTTTAPAPSRRERSERATRTVTPAVDIYETDTAFVLLADMPGVGPGGLEVVAERDQLIVRGRIERPTTEPDYQEFELTDYYRTFLLTEDLDVERIGAALKDGVLRVDIPKSPRVVPKKIPVRAE